MQAAEVQPDHLMARGRGISHDDERILRVRVYLAVVMKDVAW